jgi:hypothetical protein
MVKASDEVQAATDVQAMLDRTVILDLQIGRVGTRKKIKVKTNRGQLDVEPGSDDEKVLVDTTAEADLLHLSKDILDSPELVGIRKHDHAIRAYVVGISVPSFLRGGMYFVKLDAVEQLLERVDEMRQTREGLVEKFLTEYGREGGLVDQARQKLGDAFDGDDYPSVARFRRAFYCRTQVLTFSAPTTLRQINRALFDRVQAQYHEQMTQAVGEIQALLRAEMQELVNHMVDRLTPGEDGKAKIFRGKVVSNLSEFLEKFDLRNVAGDAELAAIVAEARGLLSGLDADQIRKQEGLRSSVQTGMAEIKARLDAAVIEKPQRLIRFEEEGAEVA